MKSKRLAVLAALALISGLAFAQVQQPQVIAFPRAPCNAPGQAYIGYLDAGRPVLGCTYIAVLNDAGLVAANDAGVYQITSSSTLITATDDGGHGYDLSTPTYATTASVSYYLTMAGADSNSCVAGAACRTLGKIESLIPDNCNHTININVDAGTYSEPLLIGSRPRNHGPNCLIQVNCPDLSTYTPATGTGTGTLTGVSVSAVGLYSVLTDTGQTWTVDDLKGRIVSIPAAGAGLYVVVKNTATALYIAGDLGAGTPSVGAAYSILTQGATFAAGSASAYEVRGVAAGAAGSNPKVLAVGCAFTGTGSGFVNVSNNIVQHCQKCRMNVSGAMASNTLLASSTPKFQFSRTYATGTAASIYNVDGLTFSLSAFVGTGPNVFSWNPTALAGTFSSYFEGTSGGGVIAWRGPSGPSNSTASGSLFLKCGAGSMFGLMMQGTGSDTTTEVTLSNHSGNQAMTLQYLNVENCMSGAVVFGNARLAVTGAALLGAQSGVSSVGVHVRNGGKVRFAAQPVTDGGTEFKMNGSAYNFSDLNLLTPKTLDAPNGSEVSIQ